MLSSWSADFLHSKLSFKRNSLTYLNSFPSSSSHSVTGDSPILSLSPLSILHFRPPLLNFSLASLTYSPLSPQVPLDMSPYPRVVVLNPRLLHPRIALPKRPLPILQQVLLSPTCHPLIVKSIGKRSYPSAYSFPSPLSSPMPSTSISLVCPLLFSLLLLHFLCVFWCGHSTAFLANEDRVWVVWMARTFFGLVHAGVGWSSVAVSWRAYKRK